jgi:glucose-6-phosphate 1-dehydrogenase
MPARKKVTTIDVSPRVKKGSRASVSALQRPADTCTMVIFGASGDLTRRMLLPALNRLARERALPKGFAVIGVARSAWNDESFRQHIAGGIEEFARDPTEARLHDDLAERLYYVSGDFDDKNTFRKLKATLQKIEGKRAGGPNRIFYLATPPETDPLIVKRLDEVELARGAEKGAVWTRVVVEKPFGRDLASARALNEEIRSVFSEPQIYRIDHYLGKETVQNILVLRFANGIFEPVWNRNYIDNVQIAVAESVGIGHRSAYYETAGVVRDMFQNHLLQLLCLTAMEPPDAFEDKAVRDEKVKVLKAIHPIPADRVDDWAVRGQYGAGVVEGEKVPAYRHEEKISRGSKTPTYAALRFEIDNWRWAGVPFYLRSGKRLARRTSEIAIEFKKVPHLLFRRTHADLIEPNVLRLRIQPDEGISLRIQAKIPGTILSVQPVVLDFSYSALGISRHGAYERLLLDVMHGDATLFTRGDEVEAAWSVVTPVLEAWAHHKPPVFPNYPSGTWGPAIADEFIERDGRRWRRL